jgi:thiol-disulfide isomerase/thioredoxin
MEKNSRRLDGSWADNKLSVLNPDEGWQPDILSGLARFNEIRRQGHSGKGTAKRWIWLALAAGCACLFAVVLPSPRVLAHRCLECTVAVWQSLAQTRPQPANLKPESARKMAPEFDLREADGKDVRLSALKGRVVVVNFWATWCHGCQLEIPSFIEVQKKYADRGLTIVGISLDDDGWKSVRPWIKERRVNYPIVIGNWSLGQKYGVTGLPETALVDREGRVANTFAGVVDRTALEQQVQTLLR